MEKKTKHQRLQILFIEISLVFSSSSSSNNSNGKVAKEDENKSALFYLKLMVFHLPKSDETIITKHILHCTDRTSTNQECAS